MMNRCCKHSPFLSITAPRKESNGTTSYHSKFPNRDPLELRRVTPITIYHSMLGRSWAITQCQGVSLIAYMLLNSPSTPLLFTEHNTTILHGKLLLLYTKGMCPPPAHPIWLKDQPSL